MRFELLASNPVLGFAVAMSAQLETEVGAGSWRTPTELVRVKRTEILIGSSFRDKSTVKLETREQAWEAEGRKVSDRKNEVERILKGLERDALAAKGTELAKQPKALASVNRGIGLKLGCSSRSAPLRRSTQSGC